MQPSQLNNISRLLLCPVHITIRRKAYPPHWKSNQQSTPVQESIGKQIRKHRLELHWLQADIARKLGVTTVSISNWERGIITPSRRMKKRIQNFLSHPLNLVPNDRSVGFCCLGCGTSETSRQLCLFERLCKVQDKNSLR